MAIVIKEYKHILIYICMCNRTSLVQVSLYPKGQSHYNLLQQGYLSYNQHLYKGL